MPDVFVEHAETSYSLLEVNWENLHYCRLIRIARIIQVQNQESMRLINNMCFLASCAY